MYAWPLSHEASAVTRRLRLATLLQCAVLRLRFMSAWPAAAELHQIRLVHVFMRFMRLARRTLLLTRNAERSIRFARAKSAGDRAVKMAWRRPCLSDQYKYQMTNV